MTIHVERDAAMPHWSSPPAARAAEMLCLICDVTWNADGGDCCWMCGQAGRKASDAMPWSALAPALFL